MNRFKDLQDFLDFLKLHDNLKTISQDISANLEVTEISRRFLIQQGPALLFENIYNCKAVKSQIPLLSNLFTTSKRIQWALGLESEAEVRGLGKMLAFLRYPSPPASWKEIVSLFPLVRRIFHVKNALVKKAVCQEIVITENIDLDILPITKSWPKDIAPLITWPLVITKPCAEQEKYNVGVYRLQKLNKDHLIVRWLKIRGGAEHYKTWSQHAKKDKNQTIKMPIAIVIGGPPALNIVAAMPIPKDISEYQFCSIIQNSSLELVKCKTIDLQVPANAEIVIEGEIDPLDQALEGPFGDHTGYYNEQEYFPKLKVKAITMKKNPIFLTTYTGKPPDEPSIIGEFLNLLLIPIIQKQFPEIIDLYLPSEGCSYRIILVSIKKTFPGQAIKILMGLMSFLEQFLYGKIFIAVDDDIDIKNWKEVIWAISTRYDPARDSNIIGNAPIDYLDFASPLSGLGGKLFIDATKKIGSETSRNCGEKINMSEEVISKIDKLWEKL